MRPAGQDFAQRLRQQRSLRRREVLCERRRRDVERRAVAGRAVDKIVDLDAVRRLVEDDAERLRTTDIDGDDGAVVTESDGGRPVPAGLPDGIPDFVIERLSDERLRAVAAGDVEMDDLL